MTIWIPGHVPSPNLVWRLPVRARIRTIRELREKARIYAHKALVEQEGSNVLGFTRAYVFLECRRGRLLNEHDNLKSSVKHYIDGLTSCQHRPRCRRGTCRGVVLPMGDDGDDYTFEIVQVKVAQKREEGVLVTITPLAGETPSPRPGPAPPAASAPPAPPQP